ncbi:sugar ABC transporter permease [Clostridium swellfunianum]|jgi:multiple sugar transport system permease protein|uniref:carbohydrate ABC transporter permease n=1 Tax=Clostridium swellfunianum TaxID=1367462 RepID=UPI00203079AB|nr:sugar ABC transporter permease [Clostridium swellfunianum]MCM0649514.1 sugar ABC transporter permease [Clostridium swellfunianum]
MQTAKSTKKGLSLNTRNTLIGMSFILPNFIGFCLFIMIPVVFSFVLSFAKWDGFNAIQFIGFSNFTAIFKDRIFWEALRHTGIYTVFSVLLSMAGALGLAVLLNKKIRGVNFFRSAVFFPYVASIVAVGAVWNAMFMKDGGPINAFLHLIGVQNPPGWFASVTWALPAVIIVSVWKNVGYFMIIYLAALQDIPCELYEAGDMDGASKWRQFWSITFPMLTPAHFFVFMMLTINSFKVFDLIFVLTDGGPGTATKMLANYIYDQSFVSWNYGTASAASIILFLIVGCITLVQFRVEKKLNFK